jgi:prevent-host-death family protein
LSILCPASHKLARNHWVSHHSPMVRKADQEQAGEKVAIPFGNTRRRGFRRGELANLAIIATLEPAMITKTSAEAQNQFGQLLDTVQREPVAITRHGRPAAFIVSPRDMESILRDKERRAKAVEEFRALSEEVRKYQSTHNVPELTDEEINRIVHEVRAEIKLR